MPESATFTDLTWRAMHDLPDTVEALAFAPNATTLAAAALDGSVALLDPLRDTPPRIVASHDDGALAVTFSPDATLLASGGEDGVVNLIDIATGNLVGTRTFGVANPVDQLAFSPDGNILAVGAGKRLRFLTRSGDLLNETEPHDGTITSVFWLEKSNQCVAASYGGIRFYRVKSPEPQRRFDWLGSILIARPSPDGRWIVSGNQDASLHVWEVVNGRELQMSGYPGKVTALAWSRSGPTLATPAGESVLLWNFSGKGPAGTTPEDLRAHDGKVTATEFLDGGKRLLSVGEDGALCLWQLMIRWAPISVIDAGEPIFRLATTRARDGTELAAIAIRGGRVFTVAIPKARAFEAFTHATDQ